MMRSQASRAIGSTAPDLPPQSGTHATFTRHEYKRHGTLSLLAGIDVLTGHVHACIKDRHRSREFIGFPQATGCRLSGRYRDQADPGQPFGSHMQRNDG